MPKGGVVRRRVYVSHSVGIQLVHGSMSEQESDKEWIEEVARPFGENSEQRLQAENLMRDRLELARPAVLPELNGKPMRARWAMGILGLLLVPIVWLTISDAVTIVRGISTLRSVLWLKPDPDAARAYFAEGLSDKDAELVVGDLDAGSEKERWKGLRERYPDDPEILAFYAGVLLQRGRALSNEVIEDAARIDPDNGWYSLMLGGLAAESAVSKASPITSSGPPDIEAPTKWTINSSSDLEEAIKHVLEAADADRIEDWIIPLTRKRIECLPSPIDTAANTRRMAYAAQISAPGIRLIMRANDAMSADAQRCAEEGDVEGLRELIRAHERISRSLLKKESTLVDALVANVCMRAPLANFRDAAQQLKLSDEEIAKLDCQVARHVARRRNMDRSTGDKEFEEWVEAKGPWAFSKSAPMISRQVEHPPILTDEDILPSRRAEHALVGRGLSFLTATILLVIAFVWWRFGRAFSGPLAGRLSNSLGRVFTAKDMLYLVAVGALLPTLLFLSWRYLDPFGVLNWNVELTLIPVLVAQFSVAILLAVCSARLAARRLVTRRISLVPRPTWMNCFLIAAFVMLLLALPVFGSWTPDRQGWPFWSGIGLAGVGPILMVIDLIAFRRDHFVDRILVRKLSISATTASGLAMMVVCGLFYFEERSWVKLDKLTVIDAENPAYGAYEMNVAKLIQEEMRQLLDDCE